MARQACDYVIQAKPTSFVHLPDLPQMLWFVARSMTSGSAACRCVEVTPVERWGSRRRLTLDRETPSDGAAASVPPET